MLEALKARASDIHEGVSQLVNEAVRVRLAEDLEDLAAFEERKDEPTTPWEEVKADLKARGLL